MKRIFWVGMILSLLGSVAVFASAPAGHRPGRTLSISQLAASMPGKEQVQTLERQALAMEPVYQALDADEIRTVRLAVLCVDFVDYPGPGHVDLSLYDDAAFGDHFGTIRDYFLTMSQGRYQIESVDLPSEIGWLRMSQPLSYYTNGSFGTGLYPRNLQKVAEEALLQADSLIDFSQYDANDDGYVDGVLIITATESGPGMLDFDLPGGIAWPLNTTLRLDDKVLTKFCLNTGLSGDTTTVCGVGGYCHELGHHLLGLIDEYDYGMQSSGTGFWCLMSRGCNLGPELWEGQCPSRLCALCLKQAGFVRVEPMLESQTQVPVYATADSGVVMCMSAYPQLPLREYYLVENRPLTGYDAYLPGEGLAIYHVDEGVTHNEEPWYPGHEVLHYRIALEQADGRFDLEMTPFDWDPDNGVYPANQGDDGDLYPGSTDNRSFTATSTPNNITYTGEDPGFAITNISDPGPVMTFDFTMDPPPLFFNKFTYARRYPNPSAIEVADLDGNGELDMVVASRSNNEIVCWLAQDAETGSYERIVLAAMTAPVDLKVADLDGDGDLDIATISLQAPMVEWLEQGDDFSFTLHEIVSTVSAPHAMSIADLDDDLDFDLVVSSSGSQQIVLFENDGTGEFAATPLVESQSGLKDVHIEDVNGDLLPDILVSVDTGGGKLIALDNQGGLSFERRDIPLNFNGVDAFVLLQENDQPFDLYLGSRTVGRFVRFVDVFGEAPDMEMLHNRCGNIASLLTTDLDGDGDEDILCGAVSDSAVTWWQNDGAGGWSREYVGFGPRTPTLACADMDGDGDKDVVTAGYTSEDVVYWRNVPLSQYSAIPGSGTKPSALPGAFRIASAWPNPFNARIQVSVEMHRAGFLTVELFNLLGQRVETLGSRPALPGLHTLSWDARGAASGTYFIRATVAGRQQAVRKVVLVK